MIKLFFSVRPKKSSLVEFNLRTPSVDNYILIPQDCEDHAILLCNLLLGFGLDAYVTIGTKSNGVAHSWVTTISPSGEVVFWESLTAQRYVLWF